MQYFKKMRLLYTIVFSCIASLAGAHNNDICPADSTSTRPIGFMRITDNKQETDETTTAERSTVSGTRLAVPTTEDSDKHATFPGGNAALRRFIKEEQRYPEECKAERANGKVVLSINVLPSGAIMGIKIIESSGNEYLDAEALRVANRIPTWTPAKDTEEGESKIHIIQMRFRPGR